MAILSIISSFFVFSCIAKPISVRETLFGSNWREGIEAGATTLDVNFTDNTFAAYTISVNGDKWLNSGMTGFRNMGNWASLKLNRTETTTGQDAFGSYSDMAVFWDDTKNEGYQFGTVVRQYPSDPDLVVFIQLYPNGAKMATTGSADQVISSFPSFMLDNSKLGYNQWGGAMAGSSERVGKLDGSSQPEGGLNNGAGPFCIFDAEMANAIVLSPLTDHFGGSDYVTKNGGSKYQMQWGILGNVTNVDEGYAISFILAAPRNGGGLNAAMRAWGDRQLSYYGKRRGNAHERDFTLNYLGYSTDNGAYYYYETEPNKNYQQTMIDVKAYHDRIGLPTKWVLLDSWWYFKGENGGVKNWTAMPSIFPGGMQAVYEGTKWKIQAHNRYYSLDNVYANNIAGQTEVGNFPFTWGPKSALPTTEEFWDYLFDINMDWGLIVYEQDWESTSADEVPLLTNTTNFGRTWLTQMGRAADKHDLSIQYCMDFTRHLMTSVEIPAVTQARASGDYHPGNDQWQVGVTAIFTSAIDIAPSKDSYWSMPNPQAGHYSAGTKEPYNRLQSAVITLSNGPVAFSDRINYSDPKVIMKCCSTSGLVLRPDTSATMIDSYFKYRAGFANSSEMESGEIWSTTSRIGENEMFRYIYVFVVLLKNDLKVYPSDVSYHMQDNTNSEWLVYEQNTTDTFMKFNEQTPLQVKGGGVYSGKYGFQLYTLIPVGNTTSTLSGWYLQGEIDKWITVSRQRFKEITYNGNGDVYTRIVGEVDETVNVGFVNSATMKQQIVSCKIGETQEAVIRMPAATCSEY